jgi:hypothetical protein
MNTQAYVKNVTKHAELAPSQEKKTNALNVLALDSQLTVNVLL